MAALVAVCMAVLAEIAGEFLLRLGRVAPVRDGPFLLTTSAKESLRTCCSGWFRRWVDSGDVVTAGSGKTGRSRSRGGLAVMPVRILVADDRKGDRAACRLVAGTRLLQGCDRKAEEAQESWRLLNACA
ncbi:hypothetical protein Aca07nite_35020 [Actinoplanes capillaceus]|uniref:Secreted protein n=1 Tax=Actinoplanes campanulatus TaxID=113559 RepID=A0ABQ3WJ17_9ACTN|nr:hypothetical protein Aca07nite_35020 [Actinoplanes capillaceus]